MTEAQKPNYWTDRLTQLDIDPMTQLLDNIGIGSIDPTQLVLLLIGIGPN